MFKFLDKAHNKIGDESCKYIATAKLVGLRDLNLSKPDKYQDNNKIHEKGCEYLCKAELPKLNTIYLCTYNRNRIKLNWNFGIFKVKKQKRLASLLGWKRQQLHL